MADRGKVYFEMGQEDGQKVILIDGEVFDWGLDDESIEQANQHSDLRSIHSQIKSHFLESLGEVLGFLPTIGEVNQALKDGVI